MIDGFEVLRDVKRDNERAREVEYERLADALHDRRERVPLEMWRALPDAD
ncbi:hypothetical protein [Streptomyces endophyticus]|uniref:Uncharacterized protein n=1 Tax=Streptomyces endophyticus TaxID=714166 RepID=A0ABU6FDU7_9ACTN|nr:hypothetical protein [Streptomyces endophyticus]MEB8341792.1 hypothetical protein [Streptomyces endophyticus]